MIFKFKNDSMTSAFPDSGKNPVDSVRFEIAIFRVLLILKL